MGNKKVPYSFSARRCIVTKAKLWAKEIVLKVRKSLFGGSIGSPLNSSISTPVDRKTNSEKERVRCACNQIKVSGRGSRGRSSLGEGAWSPTRGFGRNGAKTATFVGEKGGDFFKESYSQYATKRSVKAQDRNIRITLANGEKTCCGLGPKVYLGGKSGKRVCKKELQN